MNFADFERNSQKMCPRRRYGKINNLENDYNYIYNKDKIKCKIYVKKILYLLLYKKNSRNTKARAKGIYICK